MSEKSSIEWTDATWNPVLGCSHVSAGCDNCYAAREASGRLKNHPLYESLAVDGKFTGKVRLVPERLEQPLKWKRPRRIFVNSMSDLFHDDVADQFIAKVFAVMGSAGQHQFQVLTKRPGRMASLVGSERFGDLVDDAKVELDEEWDIMHDRALSWQLGPWPLGNVWLGTSVETQKWADVRIPKLLETPAAVRFLSCEPLLGPIDLGDYLARMEFERDDGHAAIYRSALRWVLVGGESGPNARPMHPDWARALRDQCVDAGVPFLFKQNGEWVGNETRTVWGNEPLAFVDADGSWRPAETALPAPGSVLVRRVGKHVAGRELDGRTWDEYPAPLEMEVAR